MMSRLLPAECAASELIDTATYGRYFASVARATGTFLSGKAGLMSGQASSISSDPLLLPAEMDVQRMERREELP